MTDIVCNDRVAQVQCGRANQQVFERDPHALGLPLAVDFAYQSDHFKCHGVQGHVAAQFFDKLQPPPLPGLGPRAVSSMAELCDGHH